MTRFFNKLSSGLLATIACVGLGAPAALFSAPNAHAAAVTLLSAAGFDPTSGPIVGYDLLVGNQTAVTLGGTSSGQAFLASGGAIAQGTYSASSNPDNFDRVTSSGFYEGTWGSGCSPTTSTCGGLYTSGGNHLSLGTVTNNAALFNPTGSGIANNNPIEDALAAASQATLEGSNSYTGYNGTGSFTAQNPGNVSCTTAVTCATLTATTSSADNVFNITTLDLQNGACLNISDGTAGSNARFVIDISSSMTLTNNACISLGTGVAAQDVIFNVEGSGNPVNISSAAHLYGTILAPNSNVTFNNTTLTGELIAGFGAIGSGGHSYTLAASSSTINFAAYTPVGRVPEPASIGLFGAGLAAVAAIRKQRAAKGCG